MADNVLPLRQIEQVFVPAAVNDRIASIELVESLRQHVEFTKYSSVDTKIIDLEARKVFDTVVVKNNRH